MHFTRNFSRYFLGIAAVLLLASCTKYPPPGEIMMDGTNTTSDAAATTQQPPVRLSVDEVKKAAEAGDPDAQYALGYMYYYGKGITMNKQQGQQWIDRAAMQGQPQAIEAREILSKLRRDESTLPPTVKPSSQIISAPPTSSASYNQAATTADVTVPTQTYQPDTSGVSSSVPATLAPATAYSGATAKSKTLQTTHAETAVAKPATGRRITMEELNSAPGSDYTIQLLGAYDKSDINKYISNHRLQGKTTTYRTIRNGRDWYVLVYGLYSSHSAAEAGIKRLPAVMRAQRPWVNKVSNVQKSMDKNEVTH